MNKKNNKSISIPTDNDVSALKRLNQIAARRRKSKSPVEQKRLARQFDDLVSCLPQVKFNSLSGEYFFRFDADGNERFVVSIDRLSRASVSLVAKDHRDAVRKALKLARSGEASFKDINVDTTVVSVAAN